MSKFKEAFQDELKLIMNPRIREYVLLVADEITPEYFWTCPASTGGKYHPAISLGVGGLIRHTKLAVWWGDAFCTCYDIVNKCGQRDCIIAALLLHDIYKNGAALNARGFPVLPNATSMHGGVLSTMMEMKAKQFEVEGLNTDYAKFIRVAIAGHMGIWSAPQYRMYVFTDITHGTTQLISMIVHLADYAASRKVDDKMKALQTLIFAKE